MGLPEDFWAKLPLRTDAELYDILSNQGDYLPEAVAAAKQELSKRNLAPEKVAQLEAAVQSQKSQADSKAGERLGWPMRIFIFLFCAGLFGAVLAIYYESKGYKKKAADCWVTLGISVLCHAVIGIALALSR